MNAQIVRMVVAVISTTLLACSGATEPEIQLPNGADTISFSKLDERVILFGAGFPERERLVVRDMATWSETWERIARNHFPVPPVPSVDFDSEMLLVVAMGARGSGGFVIEVEAVGELDGTVYALVNESSPSSNCGVLAVITTPVDVVRITRMDGPVQFIERSSVRNC